MKEEKERFSMNQLTKLKYTNTVTVKKRKPFKKKVEDILPIDDIVLEVLKEIIRNKAILKKS